jgi:hypothetical protein
MYDNFKILNYSNSLVSPELYARHLSKLFTGNVVNGLLVVPKTGLTVTLPTGNGFVPYGTGATASNREFSLVADFDITLDTADASNPRIDLVVVYVDMAVSLPGGTPTTANLDGPGVVKATFVKGTPNASPVDPTVGAIQTKIGAANPYIIVASVRVDATVTTIAANKITDRRVLATLSPANIAVTNAMLSTTAGELGGAWVAYTPTWTNITVGNGVITARYTKRGKTIQGSVKFLFGSTSDVSGTNISVSLPVPAISSMSEFQPLGLTTFYKPGAAVIFGCCALKTVNDMYLYYYSPSGSVINRGEWNTTTPFDTATGTEFTVSFSYEAA